MRALMLIATTLLSACAPATVRHGVGAYRPDVPSDERTPWEWAKVANQGAPTDRMTPDPRDPENINSVSSAPKDRDGLRRLHPGDAVSISIMSSTDSISYHEEIDNKGMVTIKLLGNVMLDGLTTSEAEELIERLYIERDIFKSIDVVVMAQQVSYFIRGEVKSPGQYPFTSGKTLLQAIAEAGGYTDFYDEKGEIKRGDKTLYFNTKKIKKEEQKDPQIQDGDIIVIYKSIW